MLQLPPSVKTYTNRLAAETHPAAAAAAKCDKTDRHCSMPRTDFPVLLPEGNTAACNAAATRQPWTVKRTPKGTHS